MALVDLGLGVAAVMLLPISRRGEALITIGALIGFFSSMSSIMYLEIGKTQKLFATNVIIVKWMSEGIFIIASASDVKHACVMLTITNDK